MAKLSKEKVTEIIKNRPEGVTPEEVVNGLTARGHELEGLDVSQAGAVDTRQQVADGLGLEQRSREATRPLIPAKIGESPLKAGAKAVANIPSSAFGLAKGIGQAIASPIDTAKGIGSILAGGVEKLISGVQKHEQSFDMFTDAIKDRYGSLEGLQLTATNDPLGFGLDVLGGIQAVGRGAVRAGVVEGTKLAQAGQKISEASRLTQLQSLKPLAKVKETAGKLAVSRMDKSLKLNPTDTVKIQKTAGAKPSEWLLERGIAGDREAIISKLTDVGTNSKNAVDSGLAMIKDTYDVSKEGTRVKQALQVLKDTYKGSVGNEALISQIDEFLAKPQMTLTEHNNVKRMLDRNIDIFKASGDVKAGATAKGLANIRDGIKTFIEVEASKKGFENVAELNKETQVSRSIKDAIIKRDASLQNNRAIGLTDLMIGLGAGVGVDLGTGIGVVVAKKIIEDPRVQTNIAKQLNRLSNSELTIVEKALATGIPNAEYIAIVNRVISEAVKGVKTREAMQEEILGAQKGEENQDQIINEGLRTPLEI